MTGREHRQRGRCVCYLMPSSSVVTSGGKIEDSRAASMDLPVDRLAAVSDRWSMCTIC
jgi:hypothetical protein